MPRNFTFSCSDEVIAVVDEEVVMEFGLCKEFLRESSANQIIKLGKVASGILLKIVYYCEHHIASRKALESLEGKECKEKKKMVDEEKKMIKEWDEQFLEVDKETLFAVTNAADYLKIKGLKTLTEKVILEKVGRMNSDEAGRFLIIGYDGPYQKRGSS